MAIVIAVTGLHAAALALLFSYVSEYRQNPAPVALEIELAELAPPPAPEPAPEPEQSNIQHVATPRPVTAETTLTAEVAPPDPVPPAAAQEAAPSDPSPQAPVDTNSLDVLTQTEVERLGVQAASGGAEKTGDGEVSASQISNALQQAECLNLKRQDEGTCPLEDPFDIALAIQERGIPPERLAADPRYVALSVSDKIFEREAGNRFHWPDEDMFTDPMAPGAYNARRIRNGQEPLWSQEMRDGFRKEE